ncbi:hypothetical protein Q5692_35725 [Microcoleus sp. C2C3]|uniref:hypothetical protein n=1 Tax=unclassified Microcoleus TaxID=2642155 RepID=UPI002FD594FD
MTNIFIAIAVGGLFVLIVNWKKKSQTKINKNIIAQEQKSLHQNSDEDKANLGRTILSRISTLETRVVRNESNIQSLKDNDEQKQLQINQMYNWFGSMIRHSAEEPFKKEAIEKFLAEEELKNNDTR